MNKINQRITKMGIYRIISPSNKVYIGQSRNIHNRWNYIYKKLRCERQPKLYRSLKKYGWDTHKKEILCECKMEELDQLETYYKQIELDKVKGDWSKVLFCGLYDRGGGPKSEETKRKISNANKGNKYRLGCVNSKETRQKISITNKGKKRKFPRNKEHNIKISETLKNRNVTWGNKISETKQKNPNFPFKGKHHTNESIRKMQLKGKEILCIKNGKIVNSYPSVTEAARVLGIRHVAIHNSMKKHHKCKGYIWKYKNQIINQ